VILAVDAFNLGADRRGMGRYVRRVLAGLQALGESDVRLVVRDPRRSQALAGEFDYPLIEPRDLRRTPAAAVWYPWNGMRFSPHAPSIVTIYDPFAFTFAHKNVIARLREQLPIRRALRDANAIATISQWSAAELRRIFGIAPGRLAIVPPAVDPFWRPVPAQRESDYVLFVAGPEARKNAGLLFAAFGEAFSGERVELIVAGELNAEDERAFAQLAARKRRVRPEDHELRTLYSDALAVAVPSYAEGYGIPAIEAMACGAPVIAADAAALPEACGGAAVLVASDDLIAWRDALRRVYVDAEFRGQVRAASLARVREFDPIAPARRLLEIARDLAA